MLVAKLDESQDDRKSEFLGRWVVLQIEHSVAMVCTLQNAR